VIGPARVIGHEFDAQADDLTFRFSNSGFSFAM